MLFSWSHCLSISKAEGLYWKTRTKRHIGFSLALTDCHKKTLHFRLSFVPFSWNHYLVFWSQTLPFFISLLLDHEGWVMVCLARPISTCHFSFVSKFLLNPSSFWYMKLSTRCSSNPLEISTTWTTKRQENSSWMLYHQPSLCESDLLMTYFCNHQKGPELHL